MFSLKEFLRAPSREALEACRKSDLVEVAEHLDLHGTRTMTKQVLKETVIAALENLNLLPAKGTGDLPVLSPRADDAASHENGAGPSSAAPEETAPGYQTPPAHSKTPSSPLTLPKSDPVSPASTPSSLERFKLRLKVRMAQLKYEAEEKEKRRLMEMELEIRRMDLEADTQIKLKRLELEAQAWRRAEISQQSDPHVDTHKVVTEPDTTREETTPGIKQRLDISKCIVLVPPFREFEVDSYFQIFERIAAALEWPRDVWALILQCKLTGKAQEVMSSLSLSDSLDYECVKSAVLTAYELVPEAYRQRFRALTNKQPHQTFVEFAREKLLLFEKWVAASKVSSFTELKELILLEEFKRCLPERTVLYLNEQKVATLSSAALLADEYSLTHRVSGELPPRDARRPPMMRPAHSSSVNAHQPRCVYCHRSGHVVKDCYKLKRKNEQKTSPSREVGFITKNKQVVTEINDCFQPFLSKGVVQLNESSSDQAPVIILRDTGASQTLITSDVMIFNESSATGVSVLLNGINGEPISRPLHRVFLSCELARGYFDVAVCPSLPIAGVNLLLGNDVAGGNVVPPFQVLNDPCSETSSCVKEQPGNYPACVITRAQARKREETLLLSSLFEDGHNKEDNHVHDHNVDTTANTEGEGVSLTSGCLPLPRLTLGEEQRRDDSLNGCFRDFKSTDGDESGCCVVVREINYTTTRISIPHCHHKSRACHVQMQKLYHSPQASTSEVSEAAVCAAASFTPIPEGDAQLTLRSISSPRPTNPLSFSFCLILAVLLFLHHFTNLDLNRVSFLSRNENQQLLRWTLILQVRDLNRSMILALGARGPWFRSRNKRSREDVVADDRSRGFWCTVKATVKEK
ncbi:uncharacterized protein [Nothobranchius furzeri]|uniref:uncharacterized protein n=1 Tax=Nothobranchius furzeri TaxID=105023 RepID=UPI0039049A24